MNDRTETLRAAVAAGVLPADEHFARLLRSIVDVARAIFGAKASSILLHDEETDELVFAAVSGEGEEALVGKRFASSTGIAGWVLASEEQFARLLRSIVEVARAIFAAKASSIFLFDEETDELVFAAVAGDDEQHLVGRRMPSSQGIAGWVLSSRTPLVLDDVQKDPRFARNVAEGTGYVPKGMMAVPLLDDEQALGVLQVLDRPQQQRFSLQEMELLGLFANQAAIGLALLGSARRARAALQGEGEAVAIAKIARSLEKLEDERREAADALLDALARVL